MAFPRLQGLRTLELGTPGEMRTRLNALVLADQGGPVEAVGEVLVLVGDDVQEVGRVTSVEDWREGHRRFWSSVGTTVADSSRVACVRSPLL